MRITPKKAEDLAAVFSDVTSSASDVQDLLDDLADEELKGEDRDEVGDQLMNDFDELIGNVRAFGTALGLEPDLD